MALAAETPSTAPEGATGNEDAVTSVFDTLLSDEPEYRSEASTTPPAPQPDPQADTDAQDETGTEPPQSDEAKSKDDGEESDDEHPEPPAALDPRWKVKVKVDGKDEEVTLEELQKGYSRTSDYTRKTQELAGHRKSLETETAAVRAERAQHAEQLRVLQEIIQQSVPKEPDWDKLRAEHPDRFAEVWAQWNQGEKDRTELKRMTDEAQWKVQQDQQAVRAERLKTEGERLLEVFPEWKDPKVGKAAMAEVKTFAESLGYTEQELQGIDDHRAFVILHKAMMFDKAQAKAAKARERIEVVRTATPGTGSNRPPVSDMTRALQRLAKTRQEDDLTGVFRSVLDAED